MGIKKQLSDAALLGFGAAAGRAAFERAKEELFGEDEEEKPVDPAEVAKREKASAKEAERLAKEEAKRRAREAEEKRKAKAKLEREVDDELAALKKKLGK